MTSRRQNWPALLDLFVEEKRPQPFKWGVNDCCMFARDWVIILTGVDLARELPGRWRYKTAASAAKRLKLYEGVENAFGLCCSNQQWLQQPLAEARRGDLVSFDSTNGPAMGVCVGRKSVFAGKLGIEFRLTLDCRNSWRIA